MNQGARFSATNGIGEAILKHCVTKYLGWICREIGNADVGIDATIEQVVGGNPTAKFISVQLKTGEGNVYKDRNNNFIYYIDKVHYDYWLSSSTPVILAYCDPDKEVIYWELLKKQNVSKSRTDGNFKIKLLNTHQLNKFSIDELNVIIDTYQVDFDLPILSEDDIYDADYWSELMENCAEAVSNSTLVINQLDNKYRTHCEAMERFIDLHVNGVDKKIADKKVASHAKAFKLAIDVCKTQLKSQIPIIAQTHIEALRLAEQAVNDIHDLPHNILQLLKTELSAELETIRELSGTVQLAIERFSESTAPMFDLRQSEHSFSMILREYNAELSCIVTRIEKFISTIK